MAATTLQRTRPSAEHAHFPPITEVKATTQKNGQRALDRRNSHEKKKIGDAQVYYSKNYTETSLAMLYQESELRMKTSHTGL